MSHLPLLLIAVAPKTDADRENLDKGIRRLREEDPAFSANTDLQTGHIIIGGSDELHLETIIDRLKREFSVEATVGRPQVAYKETVTVPADGEMKYAKHAEGRGQFAHVRLHVFPGKRGSGCVFVNGIEGEAIPGRFIHAIDEGIREACTRGVFAGYPVVDVRIVLLDGAYHDVDSSEMAFKIAGSMAFQNAARKALPVLLEPVMRLEVAVPDEYLSDVSMSLLQRRGRIHVQEFAGEVRRVSALLPLAEMSGYATGLRSLTRGRATCTHEFDSYKVVLIDPHSSDDDRNSRVRAPLTPIIQPRNSSIAQPEPDDLDR